MKPSVTPEGHGAARRDLGALLAAIRACRVCAAELPLFPFNRLAGLSAFVLARKP